MDIWLPEATPHESFPGKLRASTENAEKCYGEIAMTAEEDARRQELQTSESDAIGVGQPGIMTVAGVSASSRSRLAERLLPSEIAGWYGPVERGKISHVRQINDRCLLLCFFGTDKRHRWVFGGEPGRQRWWLVGD